MSSTLNTRCCIVGGGPAGMMLGFLLARTGIEVTVLEKHADFLRDFRGDTVHPSTLQVIHELGLLDAFLARPHDKARELRVTVGDRELKVANFSRLRTRCGFIAMMPQWDFLDFLCDEAVKHANFHLVRQAEVTGLIEENGVVCGVRADTTTGPIDVKADLVIGADGRRSQVRTAAGLPVRNLGAPIDVLWMRIPMAAGDPGESGGRIGSGYFLAMIHRGSYWQCAYVIPKGGIEAVRARGLDAFRAQLTRAVPYFADRVNTLARWDDIKLLSVTVDRLERWWKPGLLCIGDAAHAMSPIGGIGINLAIQDAVAAANLLAGPLSKEQCRVEHLSPLLARIQKRRMLPTRVTQAAQVAIQNRLLVPVLAGQPKQPISVPWPLKLLNHWPVLRALPAYAVGIGVRAEHLKT